MVSIHEINRLVTIAINAKLIGADALVDYTVEELREMYNGVGPESLDERIRAKLTKYLDVFAPAVLGHDVDFELSDGTRAAFNSANMKFFINCFTLARCKFSWYNPRRYLAEEAAWILYRVVCSDSGWSSWLDAKAKREAKEKISGNDAGETKGETE